MCTCIVCKGKSIYFGRNMDLEYELGNKVIVTPKDYEFSLRNGSPFRTRYAIIGMGIHADGYPLYADAVNEQGLALAGLNFPGNAEFFFPQGGKLNLAQYELYPYLLGKFSSVAEVKEVLGRVNITNIAFSDKYPLGSLHWMMSDGKESIVIEQTCKGLTVYDNDIGVLTNNPPFDYHLSNINNYMNLSVKDSVNRFSGDFELKPYCQGMAAIGLPGDTSSASRFVRAAFNKSNALFGESEEKDVMQFFHILDSVAMIRGCTYTLAGECDETIYSCCMDINNKTYYYKTYNRCGIIAVRLTDALMSSDSLTVAELVNKPYIKYDNI